MILFVMVAYSGIALLEEIFIQSNKSPHGMGLCNVLLLVVGMYCCWWLIREPYETEIMKHYRVICWSFVEWKWVAGLLKAQSIIGMPWSMDVCAFFCSLLRSGFSDLGVRIKIVVLLFPLMGLVGWLHLEL
ncbi:hypothetical protein U1Q18_023328 [Sarracenia purpurea var. burkii]